MQWKLKAVGILLLLQFGASTVWAQRKKIEIGHIDSLTSKVLQEKRGVWIYVPPGPAEVGYAPKRYPVLYLLDGDLNFSYVTALNQQLNLSGKGPEMIIVGIPHPYPTRTRDLTPTHSTKRWDGAEDRTLNLSGGGEKFLNFLETELLPYIEAKYPTVPYRLLVGHSLGGLAVLNTLATRPKLFNAYLAIEPSLWWDNTLVLHKLNTAVVQRKFTGQKLFLAVAHTEKPGLDTTQVRRDTTGTTRHTRANLALVDLLRKQKPSGLTWQWKYYPDDTHFSVALPAQHDALRGFFQYKELALPTSVTDPSFTVAAVQRHYAELSQQYGYAVLPPEETMNMYAWGYMQQKLWEKAYQFLQLNLKNYPQSYNAHASLAAYYEARNDKAKALQYYTVALRLQDLPEARQKIAELQGSPRSRSAQKRASPIW
ncbi:alpha/beta hydrolase-fold protein [Hymenobacter cellulosilyticus]|uniref:Alpha/beta hydrolase-fold protein n=1 Tax=Hymenobacter cellulosilyticus TaxID=2932248 RepID=A0A8T9QBF9_9BACT|nr:alpha/beta hydrolase-fold protein [Hymenobacter cellulosilyticus]UOQ72203.1 alpha/beta hydrolase-fold protein [Hymenobacter cellulosilyticus]